MPNLVSALFVILLFLAIFAAVFWSNWKAYTPRGFAYFCGMFLWMGVMVYGMLHSTFPSTAPKKQVSGRFDSVRRHGKGRSADYTFDIVLASGAEMSFQEGVSPPSGSHDELLLITYLDEKVVGKYPRAIAAEILTGPSAGSHRSVSASWFGSWLLCPLGVFGIFLSNFQARKNLRKKSETETTELNI